MKIIKIAHLYYDLMNLYGENGNVRFLQSRLEKQGFKAQIHFLSIDDEIDFTKYDIFYIGSGSEANEKIVLEDILKYKKDIKKAFLTHKYFLITGNALNLFGASILEETTLKEGLGLFSYQTKIEDFRMVGEQRYLDATGQEIIGFSNRNCVMEEQENFLFTVINGCGYHPNSRLEGIFTDHFYGTYLLGPIFVRNPHFCDAIVKSICNTKKVEYKEPDRQESCYKAYTMYLETTKKD